MKSLFLILRPYTPQLLLALIIFTVYLNVLNGPFIYDDISLIVQNKDVHHLSGILNFFFPSSEFNSPLFYRPLSQTFYTILYSLVGLDTTPYHVANVILHIVISIISFELFSKIFQNKYLSFFSALTFALFPIHTELVSYISGVPDLLSALFLLLILHRFFDEFILEGKCTSYALYLFYFVCALFSKEIAVVTPFICISCLLVYRINVTKKFKILMLSFFLFIFLYFLWTYFVVHISRDYVLFKSVYTDSLYVRVLTFLTILPDYFLTLFYPKDLYFEKSMIAYASVTVKAVFSVIGTLVFFFVFFRRKEVMCGIFIVLICLAPVSGILLPVNALRFDHWMYLPSIGVVLILASLYTNYVSSRYVKFILPLLVVVLSVFSYRIFLRNKQFADSVLFFENELKYYPNHKTYNLLGDEYFKQLKMYDAVASFRRAIDINDIAPYPHSSLAQISFLSGNVAEAIDEYKKALQIDIRFIPAYNGLEAISLQVNDQKALKKLQELEDKVLQNKSVTLSEIPEIIF